MDDLTAITAWRAVKMRVFKSIAVGSALEETFTMSVRRSPNRAPFGHVTVNVTSRWPSEMSMNSLSVTLEYVTSQSFSSTPQTFTIHSGGSGISESYRRSNLIWNVSSSVPEFVTVVSYSLDWPAVRVTFCFSSVTTSRFSRRSIFTPAWPAGGLSSAFGSGFGGVFERSSRSPMDHRLTGTGRGGSPARTA